jgi:hypothetical protein
MSERDNSIFEIELNPTVRQRFGIPIIGPVIIDNLPALIAGC